MFFSWIKILIESLGPYSNRFQLFEAHIPYNLHFLEQTRVVGMGWIKVQNARSRTEKNKLKTTTCDIEVELTWKHLMQHMVFSNVTFSTVTWICNARMAKAKGGRLQKLHYKSRADSGAV